MDLVRESGAQVEEVIPSNGGSVGLWPGLGKLIQILSPDEDAHLRTKSRRALEAQRKNSRQKCLEACIKNNRSQLGVAPVTASAPLSPLDQLHTLIYEKRLDGEHQLADLLLTQANLIQNSFSASTLSDFGPVIQLLVLLHNPRGESYHHESSPGSVSKLPPYFPFRSALAKVKEEDFSSGSNFRFATLDHLERNSRTYPHFHPEEFQFPGGSFSSKPTTSSSWTSKDLNPTVFQLEPGTGLTILNQDEKSLRSNLSKPIPSMKIPPLELTLAKPGAGRELRIPRDRSNRHSRISRVISYSSSQPLNHDDEGYSSPEPKSGN